MRPETKALVEGGISDRTVSLLSLIQKYHSEDVSFWMPEI